MATTIRDVVVKLNIEQNQAALKPPDTGAAVVAIDEYINALKESIQVIKIDHTSAVDALKQAVVDYGTTTSAILDKLAKEWDKAKPSPDKQPLPLPDKPEVQDTASAVVDANMKMMDSFKQAGEGAFALARGLAFINASSEDDLKKTLIVIAKFQGAFDIFKGGIDTIRGLVEATKVLSAAQAAQATAQTAVAASGATAATSMTALNIAMGPIGIAIASIAAIVGIFLYTWKEVREETKKNTEAWKKAGDSLDRLTTLKRQSIEMSASDELMQLRTSKEQVELLEKRVKLYDREIPAIQNRAKWHREMQTAVGSRDQNAMADQTAKELAALRDADTLVKEKRSTEVEIARHKIDQLKTEDEKLKKEYESYKLAKDRLKTEQERLRTMDAQFGNLTGEQQRELQRLSQKASSGQKLTRQELEQVSQLGGSAVGDYVDKQFATAGQAAGSRDVFKGFGIDVGAKEAELQSKLKTAFGKLGTTNEGTKLDEEILKRVEENVKARERIGTRTANMLENLTKMELSLEKRMSELEDTIRRNSQ